MTVSRQALLRSLEAYYPCACGVRVCGIDEANNCVVTVANLAAASEEEARAIFYACKKEAAAVDDEPCDLVVDLNIDADNRHVDDFSMSRQMLERCLAAGRMIGASETGELR